MKQSNGYFTVSHWVLEHPNWLQLTLSAKVLYFTLCKHRNRYGRRKPYFIRTEDQLIKDTGLSRRSVKRAKAELKDKGFIICSLPKPGKKTKWEIFEGATSIPLKGP